MKAVWFAAVTLTLLLCFVVTNSLVLKSKIELLKENIIGAEENNMDEAHKEYNSLFLKYNKLEKYMSLTVNHEDLANIENAFAEIIGAANADDKTALLTTKSRLIDYLSHIRRLSGINIDSIL